MKISKTDAYQISERAAQVYAMLRDIVSSTSLCLRVRETGRDKTVPEGWAPNVRAASNLSQLAEVAALFLDLKDRLSGERGFAIRVEIENGELDRPSDLPNDRTSCIEFAGKVILDITSRLESKLCSEAACSLGTVALDQSRLYELAGQIEKADEQSAVHVLEIIAESFIERGYLSESLDSLYHAARREGAFLASLSSDRDEAAETLDEANEPTPRDNRTTLARNEVRPTVNAFIEEMIDSGQPFTDLDTLLDRFQQRFTNGSTGLFSNVINSNKDFRAWRDSQVRSPSHELYPDIHDCVSGDFLTEEEVESTLVEYIQQLPPEKRTEAIERLDSCPAEQRKSIVRAIS